MLGPIKQIAIVVKDLETSKAFYRDRAGLKFLFDAPPGLAFFDCNGIWLMLGQASEEESGKAGDATLYFSVDDINRTYETMKANGVEFVDQPHRIADMGTHELWMAFFRDPDGVLLALRAEIKK